MSTARQRRVILVVALATLSAAGAFVYGVWRVAFAGEQAIDCDRYAFPTQRWRAALRQPLNPNGERTERRARRLARNVVRCDLVLGRTAADVRALLGRPDSALTDGNPRPHREWTYDVGLVRDLLDDEVVSLHMEFDSGRVAYVNAPGRTPGLRGGEISAGSLVGGGARFTPP